MTNENSEYNNVLIATNLNPLELEVFGNVVIKKLHGLNNVVDVYCQACGKDITQEGGIISVSSGKVYCYTNGNIKPCLDKEILDMMKDEVPKMALGFHYLYPEKVQEKIIQKKLINFGPLERKLEVKNAI